MNRLLRLLLAVALPGVVFLLALAHPQAVLQRIILPAATVMWLLLRIFVLSIGQEVYWWGLIAIAMLGLITFLLSGGASSSVTGSVVSRTMWDPARWWRNSILLNIQGEPSQDSFRRDLSWLLSSIYASSHPGGAKYQVREALEERRIAVPPGIYDFLFASTRPRKPGPFFSARAAMESLSEAIRLRRLRRRKADYIRSADEVLAFIETQLEMTHEFDSE